MTLLTQKQMLVVFDYLDVPNGDLPSLMYKMQQDLKRKEHDEDILHAVTLAYEAYGLLRVKRIAAAKKKFDNEAVKV